MDKILLVEDNSLILKGLGYSLKQNKYLVDYATNYQDSKNLLNKGSYDLVIIDILLPDKSGLELGQYIYDNLKIPFLFLTASDEEESIVQGLAIAEDYLTKPFLTKELLTRIKKIIARTKKNNQIIIDNLKIDLDKCLVYLDSKEVNLTSLEFKILKLLLDNQNKVVLREVIIDKIWDINQKYVNDNTLSVYIKRIRKKLKRNDLIKTIKGIGYRIDI